MKKVLVVFLLIATIMSLNVSVFAAGNKKLSLKQAKKVAAQYVGARKGEAVFTKAQKDYDDGHQVYELEFHAGNKEYKIDVDMNSGKILKYSEEYCDDDMDDFFDWDD